MTLIANRHMDGALGALRSFRGNDWGLAVVDDFLTPGRIAALARDAAQRDDYAPDYGLVPTNEADWTQTLGRHVGRAEYYAAPPDDRYWKFSATRSWSYSTGQRQLDVKCPFTLPELDQLLQFTRAATGYSLAKIRVILRRFEADDFIGAHTQNRMGRLLAAQLPLSVATDGLLWRLEDSDRKTIEVPLEYNSFSYFDVRVPWREGIAMRSSIVVIYLMHFWFYSS